MSSRYNNALGMQVENIGINDMSVNSDDATQMVKIPINIPPEEKMWNKTIE